MSTGGAISSLMFFTLGAVVLIIVILLVSFLRKRSNRHPMSGVRERNIEEIRGGEPPKRE